MTFSNSCAIDLFYKSTASHSISIVMLGSKNLKTGLFMSSNFNFINYASCFSFQIHSVFVFSKSLNILVLLAKFGMHFPIINHTQESFQRFCISGRFQTNYWHNFAFMYRDSQIRNVVSYVCNFLFFELCFLII